MKVICNTTKVDQVLEIAALIGGRLKGGEVIELVSDVGGGKTTFTKGLVAGARSKDHVSSPTFTISNIYKCPHFAINHFDFYRLGEAGLMRHELEDVMQDPKTVIVVEWSDVVRHVLPDDRLTIQFTTTDETGRMLQIEFPESLAYLVDALPHVA